MLYDDFTLIEKNIIKTFIKDINKNEDFYLECLFTDGKIIINNLDNLNIDKYISVIGNINNEKTFDIEYILIYKNNITNLEKKSHIKKISKDLTNYLKGLQLYQNSAPIINDNYKELGVIVKYDKNNDNNLKDNNSINNSINNSNNNIIKNIYNNNISNNISNANGNYSINNINKINEKKYSK